LWRIGLEADSSESHVEDALFLLHRLNWLGLGLGLRRDIHNAVEDIVVIHDVLDPFGLDWLGLRLLGLSWLWLLDDWSFSISGQVATLLVSADMLIVVDSSAGVGHLETLDIEVHVCFSHWDALEGLDGGLEGRHGNADLLLPVRIPSVFE
jgi:hypothetical protein